MDEQQKQGRVTVMVDTITVKDIAVQRIIANALAVNGYDVEIMPEKPARWPEVTTATLVIRQVV